MPTFGAEFLDNLQDVRGEKDRRAPTDALLEGVAQHARGNGINALEGFIEEQKVRIGDQGRGQGELLFHPVGELEREFLLLVRQVHHVQQLVATRADGSRGQQIHAANEGEVFAGGQIVEQREVFRHYADAALDLQRAPRVTHVLAQQAHCARARRQQPGKHLDGGGLARAVGAEKAIEPSRLDAQTELVDGAKLPEVPCQVGGFDGWVHGVWIAG